MRILPTLNRGQSLQWRAWHNFTGPPTSHVTSACVHDNATSIPRGAIFNRPEFGQVHLGVDQFQFKEAILTLCFRV